MLKEHPKIKEIDERILNMDVRKETLESIAEEFKVDPIELTQHAVLDISATPPQESLARQLKIKEADALATLQEEYLCTVRETGDFIRSTIQDAVNAGEPAEKVAVSRLVTKPLVELYVGAGAEVRNNAKTLAELKTILQGGEGGPLSGLAALAAAIQSSGRENST